MTIPVPPGQTWGWATFPQPRQQPWQRPVERCCPEILTRGIQKVRQRPKRGALEDAEDVEVAAAAQVSLRSAGLAHAANPWKHGGS